MSRTTAHAHGTSTRRPRRPRYSDTRAAALALALTDELGTTTTRGALALIGRA